MSVEKPGLSEKEMGITSEGAKKISPQEINAIIGKTDYFKVIPLGSKIPRL